MSTPTIPAGLDFDGMTADERRQHDTRQAVHALALLLQMVPADIRIFEWRIMHDAAIEIMPSNLGDHHAERLTIRRLADELPGFEFVERPHSTALNRVTAVGLVANVRVEFWTLLRPCTCTCHRGAL